MFNFSERNCCLYTKDETMIMFLIVLAEETA